MSTALACRVFGDGPPLVILHGLLGSSRNWQGLGKALGRHFRVIAPDLRNHGASPWCDSMDYAAMAGDVAALMDDRGIDHANLVGHSMGGKVAMALALLAPGRVERLVVVDIAPVGYEHDHEELIQAMLTLDLGAMRRRDEVDAALAEDVPDQAARTFLVQNLGNDPEKGLHWRPNLDVLLAEMRTMTGWPGNLAEHGFSGPSLFLSGGQSDYVQKAHDSAISAQFPAARRKVIEEAGHWLHADAPQAFIKEVETFLGDPGQSFG